MKTKAIILIIFVLILAILLLPDAKINKSFWGDLAIDGYDPVAYYSAQVLEGKKEFTYKHLGANWRFSSQTNLEQFKANPSAYMPQYGGYCAWAMANGYTADIDPKSYKIVDNKLYLNYNTDIQKQWEADYANLIQKADKNWQEKFIGE